MKWSYWFLPGCHGLYWYSIPQHHAISYRYQLLYIMSMGLAIFILVSNAFITNTMKSDVKIKCEIKMSFRTKYNRTVISDCHDSYTTMSSVFCWYYCWKEENTFLCKKHRNLTLFSSCKYITQYGPLSVQLRAYREQDVLIS